MPAFTAARLADPEAGPKRDNATADRIRFVGNRKKTGVLHGIFMPP
jgi:hypothetical protein